MNTSSIRIVELRPADYAHFVAHMDRHISESGRNGIHFMPFVPGDTERPVGAALDKLLLGIDAKGWHRCWMAVDTTTNKVVGHIDLKGSPLKTGRHRCDLGMGIEEAYRGKGIGAALMDTAIAFASAHPQLYWIDLGTFSGNLPARALYRKKGFTEVGIIKDRFRINGISIDDVLMTLQVKD